MRKILDLISLTLDLIRNNKKLVLPTVIGLIIALIILSEAFVLVESSRQNFFNEIVLDSTDTDLQFSSDISIELSAYFPDVIKSDRFTNFSHYESIFNTSAMIANYNHYIMDYWFYSNPEIAIKTDSYNNYPFDTIVYSCSSLNIYNQLEQNMNIEKNGRIPQNSSEILIIRPNVSETSESYNPFIHNLTLNSNITLVLPEHLHDLAGLSPENRPSKNVTVVGIIEVSATSYKFTEIDPKTRILAKYLSHQWTESVLFTYPSFSKEILDEIYDDRVFDMLEVYSSRLGIKHMDGKVFLKPEVFDAYHPQTELANIENFIDTLSDGFEDWGYNAVIQSRILEGIRSYMRVSSNLLIMLLLIGAPVIAISFYLMIYSFELIKRQRRKQLGIIKTRGASWKQLIVTLYGEIILGTIGAAIFGFIISIFLANLALRSTDYIEFFGRQVEVKATIEVLFLLICIGLLLALFFNFHRIIKTAREDIEETIVPFEARNPFWKRYYLDLFIFICGTLFWFALLALIRSLSSSASTNNIPIQVLLIIAPFLIFIGSILIVGRLFYFFINKLAKIAWRLDWGIFSFAIHNIIRYKHAANRAVLLLTLAVSFSIISSSLIFSLDETEDLRFYSLSGADLSFSFDEGLLPTEHSIYDWWWSWNWKSSIDKEAVKLITNMSHVTGVSTVFTAKGMSEQGYGYTEELHYNFLFVDVATYAKTVDYHSEFQLDDDLSLLLEKLNNNASVLMLRKNVNALGVKIGHNVLLPIYSTFHGWNTDRYWRVVGTFGYWPNMLINTSANYSTDFWMIGSLGLLERLVLNCYLFSLEAKCLINVDTNENVENIAETVETLGYSPSVPSIETDEYLDSFTRQFNLSVLNINVIISMAIAIVCMIMFAFYIYLERGKEIGIERALGTTRLQTAQLFFIETSIIICFGIIFGSFIGTYFTSVFFQITQIGALPTPFVIVTPLQLRIHDNFFNPLTIIKQYSSDPPELIIQYISCIQIIPNFFSFIQIIPIVVLIFVVSVIGILLPAYIATRTDISRILKVE